MKWCCFVILSSMWAPFPVRPLFDMVMLVILKETEPICLSRECVFEGYCDPFIIAGVLEYDLCSF